MRFEAKKKHKKKGFFGVFRSALKRFGFLLYDSDDAQTHHLAAQLDASGAATLKKTILWKTNLRFEPKNVEKMGFLGSSGLH